MGRLAEDFRQGARRRSSGITAMSPYSTVFLVVVAISAASTAPFFSKGGSSSGSYGTSMMQPYKPSYMKMNSQSMKPKLPDFGMILKNVLRAKKGLINKFLAPIIGIKKSLFETKKKLITPLIRPILSLKKKKLGFLRGLIDTKSSLIDSFGQMLGGRGATGGYGSGGMRNTGYGGRMKNAGRGIRRTWNR